MDAHTQRMPGDAEAEAAIRELRIHYGHGIAVGDSLNWRRESWPPGRAACDLVLEVSDGGFVVDHDGERTSVANHEVLPF